LVDDPLIMMIDITKNVCYNIRKEIDMDSKHYNGALSEMKAALWYLEQGCTIFWPTLTQASCDFIALYPDGTPVRVQVKSAYWITRPTGRKYLMVTTRRGCGGEGYKTYTKEHCDDIFIVSDDRMWLIPVEVLSGAQSICLDKGQDVRSRSNKRSFNAEEYEIGTNSC